MADDGFKKLRQRAEAMLELGEDSIPELTPSEIKKLFHNLTVHQIELELQNEELLRAQHQIESARDELARLYHQAPVGYLTLTCDGVIERCNQTFSTMVGEQTEQLVGRALSELLMGADRELYLGRFRAFCKSPADKSMELCFCDRQGYRSFYGRLTAVVETVVVPHGRDCHKLLVVIQDISEQRTEALVRGQAEQKLKNHAEFMSTLLETMPIPIFYKDTACRYLGCNRAFRDFVGLDESQIIGKTVFDLAPAEIAVNYDELDRQLLASPGAQTYEWKVRTADESIKNVIFNKATFVDADGQLAGIVGAILDITELKELQCTMQVARDAAENANRAKSEFLANMSHELRTPMNGVLGMAQLLQLTELDAEQQECVDAIMKSGLNMVQVIGDILDLSKIEANHVELEDRIFSLGEVIHEQLNLLRPQAQSRGLGLFCRIAPELPEYVCGDPTRLGQIILNLLGNAIKFTSAGSVSITAIEGGTEGEKISLRISVSDTGIGIKQSDLQKLFLPFSQVDGSTTRRFGGTGLGLAISKHLVELMGGVISVESSEGVGSTFFVRLALKRANFSEQEIQAVTDNKPSSVCCHGNCRILVVDDDPLSRKVVAAILGKQGYNAEVAVDGDQAVAMLAVDNFDLVLMDCSMPGLDGYEAAVKIRAGANSVRNPQIPIIALTARVLPEDREKCIKAGMNDYLAKPMSCEELSHMIKRWLKQPNQNK